MAGFIFIGFMLAACVVIERRKRAHEPIEPQTERRSLMGGAATPLVLSPLIKKATYIKPPIRSTWEPPTPAGYPRAVAVDEHPVVPIISVGSRRRRPAVRKGKAVG